MMGAKLSVVERDIYEHLNFIFMVHGKKVGKKELKNIVKWVFTNISNALDFNILSKELWDSGRVKLYDLTI